MRVLIADDSDVKVRLVRRTVEDAATGAQLDIVVAPSVADAARCLTDGEFDLLILDVRLPMRRNEAERPDGASILLEQIQARNTYNVPEHIIGLTAYEEVPEETRLAFSHLSWSLLFYSESDASWQRAVTRKVEHIINAARVGEVHDYQADLCIVTALDAPELKAVTNLPGDWDRVSLPNDATVYRRSKWKTVKQNDIDVYCASAFQMGMPAAGALAMKMCMLLRPRFLAMVGICAGVDLKFGDIVVAERSWDYGSGKNKGVKAGKNGSVVLTEFEPAPTQIPISQGLSEKFKQLKRDEKLLRKIESEWTGPRPPHALSVKTGSLASGAAVLENQPLVEMIKGQDRKVYGIDMEAYAIFLAGHLCPAPRPECFVIKSVSDKGSVGKDDEWQEYASYTSSRYLYEFATRELFPDR